MDVWYMKFYKKQKDFFECQNMVGEREKAHHSSKLVQTGEHKEVVK